MKIQVLGCSAVELPNANLPSFLVDGKILLDAGTIGTVLDEDRQWKISHVLITHAHLDHVKDLPFFADTISVRRKKHHITVISIKAVIRALRENLLNDVLWPDFTRIPTPENPIIRMKNIETGEKISIDGHSVWAYKVNHSVPAVAYLLEDRKGKRLLYMGDAGPSNTVWKSLDRQLQGLIIEVSLPNRFKAAAIKTGHLTPGLLASELKKMKFLPEMIFITHCKPVHSKTIKEELNKLGLHNIQILRDGAELVL